MNNLPLPLFPPINFEERRIISKKLINGKPIEDIDLEYVKTPVNASLVGHINGKKVYSKSNFSLSNCQRRQSQPERRKTERKRRKTERRKKQKKNSKKTQ
jgi:hypothetical protein